MKTEILYCAAVSSAKPTPPLGKLHVIDLRVALEIFEMADGSGYLLEAFMTAAIRSWSLLSCQCACKHKFMHLEVGLAGGEVPQHLDERVGQGVQVDVELSVCVALANNLFSSNARYTHSQHRSWCTYRLSCCRGSW